MTEQIIRAYQEYLEDTNKGKFDSRMQEIKDTMEKEHGGESHRLWRTQSREAYSIVRNQRMQEVMKSLEPPDIFLSEEELVDKREIISGTQENNIEPRKKSPRPSSKDIIQAAIKHRETLSSFVPQVNAKIQHAERSLKEATCTGCARNRIIRNISSSLSRASRLKTIDVEEVIKQTDEVLRPLFNPLAAQGAIKTEDGALHRESCKNCVVKHLAQASSLCDEVLQGYPGHVDMAIRHLGFAIEKAPPEDAFRMKQAIEELQGAMEVVEEPDKCRHYLLAAGKLILQASGLRRGRLRLIGHLGEAADECVLDNPMLAELIRTERMKTMDNPEYTPDIDTLLNVASGMIEKKP